MKDRVEIEKKTVKAMIKLFCKSNHKQKGICIDCTQLIEYATFRTDQCKFKENKPACKHCSVHCYKPKNREKIQSIMRYSGPRMIFKHPLLSLHHFISKFQSIK